MRDLGDYIGGPFNDEAAFKAAVLKRWRGRDSTITRFEVENEEKAPGMPDCLSIMPDGKAFFTELKVSDKNGVITFERTQPLFYKQYGEKVGISILAWDKRFNRVVQIEADEVTAAKSLRIQIPEKI